MKKLFKNNPAIPGFILLIALVVVGVMLVFAYAKKERDRDLQAWQIRLGVTADSRVQAVDSWLEAQHASLRELADNGTVPLYLMQLGALGTSAAADVEPAQLSYLRNLVLATAERGGFIDKSRSEPLQASVAVAANTGLALLDQNAAPIVSTRGLRPDPEIRRAAAEVVKTGKRVTAGIYLNAANKPVVAFLTPVFALQDMRKRGTPIGVIVGVKNAEDELFPLLTRQVRLSETEETLLLRSEDGSVVYLSPLADGSPPLKKRLNLSTAQLEGAFAIQSPGTFAKRNDYRGVSVLMTSRTLTQVPWVLVHKIGAAEALKESDTHQRFLLTVFLLAIALVAVALVAAWRHGSSLREQQAALAARESARQLRGQTALLHSITDSLTDYIYIVDQNQNFSFANRALAKAASLDVADFPGKTLSSVLGPETSRPISELLAKTAESHQPQTDTMALAFGGAARTYHTSCVPLAQDDHRQRLLVISHDITELQTAQAKRDHLMRQVLKTLMRAVDLYDHYSTDHSSKTIQVALAIGEEMQLGKGDLEVLEMAANLANIGKLAVPREILSKTEPLNAEEQEILRKHVMYAVELLSGLEFDGPVLETIGQRYEHIDGSGYPAGLSADQILLTAKILAVANAFVAMVSPRAYRSDMGAEQALDQLLAESKSKYDRHVVAALFHVAENRPESITLP